MAAVTILIPVAKQILGKATDLATEQLGLLLNFKPELRKLKDTVSTIQAVLHDAEEKQVHNHQVKLWLEKLSDAMYDAEDLLDDLSTEARRKAATEATNDFSTPPRTTCWSVVCFLFSSLPKQLWYDLMMARAIKVIIEKLDDLMKDKEALHLEVHPTEEDGTLPSRETDSCPPTIVVGREDDKKNIIQLLLNSNCEANISVVFIVGMGGLGKTTLAQLIYDDHQVKDHFDITVWVYVSQSFDVKVILEKMLQSLDGQNHTGPGLDVLQAQLREKIKGKRFLFVLDDVWEETNRNWEILAKYMTVGALGSKVLVTTRSMRVAEVGSRVLKSETSTSTVEPYQLKGLSEEECWNLLVRKAISRKAPRDKKVQEIGKEILRKCDGVPLAVSTIVGVLVDSRDPKTEWPSFLQKGISSICKKGEEDPTMATLRLSFNHLPSHMKHCFTYCKLFQKGFRLNIQQLVRFWLAQGYIESEDKGFDCFKTLWWRSFFHDVKIDMLGNISTCRMHDLMHDLVDTLAGEKIIRSSSSTVLKNIPSKTRHLAISGDDSNDIREENYVDGMRNASKVRTLICYVSLSRQELKQVLDNFLCLRLLIFQRVSNTDGEDKSVLDAFTLMNSIDKLKHLRYFGFNCTGRKNLPEPVTNLVNLQVLDLRSSWSLQELPRNTKKLVNLKHLELDPLCPIRLTHMPKGIGELKFIQSLPIFVVGKKSGSCSNDELVWAGLDELKGLNALSGELTIQGLADAASPRKGAYVLKEKQHLQSLVLDWCRDNDKVSTHDEEILEMLRPHPNLKSLMIYGGYQGVKLPNWLSGLTNLVKFSLRGCKQCEYLPSQMYQMSSLKKLIIKDCPMLKGISNDGDSYVDNSSTERLATDGDYYDSSGLLCLSYLSITNCTRLTWLPTFPIVEVELKLCNVSLVPFARTMEMEMSGEGCLGTNALPSSSSSSTLVHPFSKLTKLTFERIEDDLESLAHPNSSTCLISLMELRVLRCNRVVKLPGSLCSSIYLKEICVGYCLTVEYLPPLHELPSLRELAIEYCPKLKGCWWKKTKKQGNSNTDEYYNFDPSVEGEEEKKEDEETEEEEEWPHFPCLTTLEIKRCPKLTRMPLFPTVEGQLQLWGTSAEALVRTIKMKPIATNHHHHLVLHTLQHTTTATTTTTTTTIATTTSSSSSSPPPPLLRTALVLPLSKLTILNLFHIDDLESLPEEDLHNLTSLQKLEICSCPRLASLPPAMQHLTSLQELCIRWCPLLSERCRKGEGEDWPNISHISKIRLDRKLLQ